jgi:hypothetical protein
VPELSDLATIFPERSLWLNIVRFDPHSGAFWKKHSEHLLLERVGSAHQIVKEPRIARFINNGFIEYADLRH